MIFCLASSSMNVWPILMSTSIDRRLVSVVGVFWGKPTAEQLLGDLVMELADLCQSGLADGTPIRIGHITCDLQAFALIKCIKAPNGYSSCPKCTIEGDNSDVRPGVRRRCISFCIEENYDEEPARTDESFRAREDEDHHNSEEQTPFERLPSSVINMVTHFVVDSMHAIYQNLLRRTINYWSTKKLHPPGYKNSISGAAFQCAGNVWAELKFPKEFTRQPRSFEYFPKYKASELRMLLLYGGERIFRPHITKDGFQAFIMLVAAVRILSSKAYYLVRFSKILL